MCKLPVRRTHESSAREQLLYPKHSTILLTMNAVSTLRCSFSTLKIEIFICIPNEGNIREAVVACSSLLCSSGYSVSLDKCTPPRWSGPLKIYKLNLSGAGNNIVTQLFWGGGVETLYIYTLCCLAVKVTTRITSRCPNEWRKKSKKNGGKVRLCPKGYQ